jgi:hypothetical protein
MIRYIVIVDEMERDSEPVTLVATRGPNFPLGRLEGRLMCPVCGNRRVTVVFEPPSNAQVR